MTSTLWLKLELLPIVSCAKWLLTSSLEIGSKLVWKNCGFVFLLILLDSSIFSLLTLWGKKMLRGSRSRYNARKNSTHMNIHLIISYYSHHTIQYWLYTVPGLTDCFDAQIYRQHPILVYCVHTICWYLIELCVFVSSQHMYLSIRVGKFMG